MDTWVCEQHMCESEAATNGVRETVGARRKLNLAHALQGGIPVDPNRPGTAMDVCKSVYHVVEHLSPTPPSGQRAANW